MNKAEDTEVPQKAPTTEVSWIEMIVWTPIAIAFFTAAAVGAYFIVTTWSTTTSTIEPSGIVRHEQKKWWGVYGGQTIEYEYNHVGGHWSKSVKLQREKEFSRPEHLPRASLEIGQ